jgi:hypothetical protein
MAVDVLISQTVHVVSIDDVTIRLAKAVFQEKDVSGGPEDVLGTLDWDRHE